MNKQEVADEIALERMRHLVRGRPGITWFAYMNQDLGHPEMGHVQFLAVGPDCTFKTPPACMPDTDCGLGWRYVKVGPVDLVRNEIMEEPRCV